MFRERPRREDLSVSLGGQAEGAREQMGANIEPDLTTEVKVRSAACAMASSSVAAFKLGIGASYRAGRPAKANGRIAPESRAMRAIGPHGAARARFRLARAQRAQRAPQRRSPARERRPWRGRSACPR